MNKIKAVIFDIGGTLMEYKNMPYVWTEFYPTAFEGVRQKLKLPISDNDINKSVEILKHFNPRINYREEEITPERIFTEATASWRCPFSLSEIITVFFRNSTLRLIFIPKRYGCLKR